jgi:hypothetical protein
MTQQDMLGWNKQSYPKTMLKLIKGKLSEHTFEWCLEMLLKNVYATPNTGEMEEHG